MTYEATHQLMSEMVRRKMSAHLQRLDWSRQQVEAFQLSQMKSLIQHVKQYSPFYQKRCLHCDPEHFSLDDLTLFPTLTKQDVLTHWDDIVCVPHITKKLAETHLEHFRDKRISNPFYQERYYFTATGGSSGLRGLYLWDLDAFAEITCAAFRYQVRDERRHPPTLPRKIVVLTAPTLIHASTPLFTTSIAANDDVQHMPADLPIQVLCAKLNEFQPTQLIGYASTIVELAHQQRQGKLHISPQRVCTNSEPLYNESRLVIETTWSLRVNNMWGSVEMGIAAVESDDHQGLIMAEDMVLIEPVDEQLQPVKHAQDAKKLLITNLVNKALPLIRYVVDDVVHITARDNSPYRMVDSISGRTHDWFRYPGEVLVHPVTFLHLLGLEAAINEYQVEQIETGAIIRLVTTVTWDSLAFKQRIEEALSHAGVMQPMVVIELVSAIPRHHETGKLKRFIPLNY